MILYKISPPHCSAYHVINKIFVSLEMGWVYSAFLIKMEYFKIRNNIYAFSNYGMHLFSNKHINNIEINVDGHTMLFNCVEQYLQYSQAILFQEFQTAKAIMKEKNPIKQSWLNKSLRRKYSLHIWYKNLPDILLRGLEAKFQQHKHLKLILLQTKDYDLVQACTWDQVFSCGIGLDSPNIWSKQNWTTNLMGETLMKLRESWK